MYTYDDNNDKPKLPQVLDEVMQHLKPGAIVATYSNNPTCPQCLTPIVARDAMLVMGQVAIWLQCENGHDVVEIVPVSRFVMTVPEMVEEMLIGLDEIGNIMAEIKAAWHW